MSSPRKGVVAKLFGVILMALGALDSMLAWRAGLADGDAYLFLILGGALLYALGANGEAIETSGGNKSGQVSN